MMKARLVIPAMALILGLAGAVPALAATGTQAALDYLQTQQNADGGFGSGFSPESTVGSTADAVFAIIAAGAPPSSFDQDGNTPLTYLADHAATVDNAGDLAKLILAIVAAGENPRTFGGVDSVARLEGMAGSDGRFLTQNDTFFSHILAVLAVASVERPLPEGAVAAIKDAQQETGAWAWDGSASTDADTNTTAFAVQALVAAGEPTSSEAITGALDYYRSIQNADGGWPYQSPSSFGTDTDANSTALTIQALIAAGQDPAAWTSGEGNDPVSTLEAFQNESGAFAWQAAVPDDNLLATVQALPALAGKAFPLATTSVGAAAATPAAAPAAIPETGGAVANLALPLLLSGLALAGGGYALQRKR